MTYNKSRSIILLFIPLLAGCASLLQSDELPQTEVVLIIGSTPEEAQPLPNRSAPSTDEKPLPRAKLDSHTPPLKISNDPRLDRVNCSDFTVRYAAQLLFDLTSGDPNQLDKDGDGVACEILPNTLPTTTDRALKCSDFTNKSAAQIVFNMDKDKLKALDRNRDGAVCTFLR